MSRFDTFWRNHPGHANVCDAAVFGDQCAMRVGAALRIMGVDLHGMKTCVGFNKKRFAAHKPGHTRSAQQLANHFYRKPKAHNLQAKSFKIYHGSISKNIAVLKDKNGMIFIQNGWGSTDHIDAWEGNGVTGELKGGQTNYFNKGRHVWFWEFD